MSHFWTFLTHVHTVAGPVTMLLYPLYASVMAIESPGKEDDEQWLAYWIIYSFLTLSEMLSSRDPEKNEGVEEEGIRSLL
ncbi:unnamed protein product [Linum tenue]|uniref:HVA22-like protein n=1 Tax=Linum tenue TaxID=586396 RepID=A0AAV0QMG2_9ROSI|nr:unnamed protein product [Linum tenue]